VRALWALPEKAFAVTIITDDRMSGFYVVGGTMRPDAPSYVERQADSILYTALMRRELCYVLTARQMGKSSLIIRSSARLRDAGVAVAVLDLTAVGQNLTVGQWYGGLLSQIGQRLGMEDELLAFWPSQPLGPMRRWISAIRRVVLSRIPTALVIFVDEIDAVRSLPFSTDEFFAGIRDCYNQRSEDSEMERVTFCLSGVAVPSDLVRDPRTTPFNIGRRIELHDFAEAEAAPLARGLGRKGDEGRRILKRVMFWTGGHPYLTQRLCQAVAEAGKVRKEADVDRVCDEMFFSRPAQERDHNLLFVRESMLRGEADVGGLLELYARIRNHKTIQDQETNPLVSILRLSGITRAEGGRIRVRNRIYAHVFDKEWISANLPGEEVRRQRAAFRRGVMRSALVSAVILVLMGWLSLTVIRERNRAERQAVENRRLLYFAQMKLVGEEWENANIGRVEELLDSQIPKHGEEDMRGFEWYLFLAMAHRDVFRLPEGHPIENAVFLPDHTTLAIAELVSPGADGADEHVIKLYDLNSRNQISSFQVPAGQNFDLAVFSPDKRRVAVDGPAGRIEILDVYSGRSVADCGGHTRGISAIAFSPSGRHLISADLGGIVKIWDATTGKETKTLHVMTQDITCITFTPDSKSFATTDGSNIVRVWSTATGRPRSQLQSRDSGIVRCSFFPDGRRLLSSAKDGLLQVWDVRTRRIVSQLSGHSAEARYIAFSRDGESIATASNDRTVRVWEAESGHAVTTIRGHGASVKSVAWSMDGKFLITGGLDGYIKMWNAKDKDGVIATAEPQEEYFAACFSSKEELIALGAGADGRATLWNLSTGKIVARLDESRKNILCAGFSRDSTLLATGGKDHLVKVWDARTGSQINALRGHTAYVKSVDFSPNGEVLVSSGEDGTMRLWKVTSGRQVETFKGGEDNYFGAVFSPDGNFLASSQRSGSVKLTEVVTGQVSRTLDGHVYPPRAIAFSLDGARLVTGGRDNTIRLWEVATGRELKQFQADSIKRAAFSLDGKRLITGGEDGYVRLWDLTTQQELVTLQRHPGGVSSVTFSPDGRSLATSGQDGTISLWRTKSAR
jgi:WD40 repeat protein